MMYTSGQLQPQPYSPEPTANFPNESLSAGGLSETVPPINIETLTLSRGIPFASFVMVPLTTVTFSQPNTSTVNNTTTRHALRQILMGAPNGMRLSCGAVFGCARIEDYHSKAAPPASGAC